MPTKVPPISDGGPDTDEGDEATTTPRVATYSSERTYEEQMCIGCNTFFDPDPPYKGYYCEDCRRRL